MRQCERIDEYLDGVLDEAPSRNFEQHMEGCAGCAGAVDAWKEIENSLREKDASDPRWEQPTHQEAARLVWRAQKLHKSGRTVRLRTVLVAAGLLLAIGAALTGVLSLKDNPQDNPLSDSKAELPLRDDGFTLVPPDMTGFELQGAQVMVDPGSALSYRAGAGETIVRLEAGQAAFEVEPRDKTRPFVVEAGQARVVVVGTVFSVAREEGQQVRVSVAQGKVQVEYGKETSEVSPGESVLVSNGEHRRGAPRQADLELLRSIFQEGSQVVYAPAPVGEAPREDIVKASGTQGGKPGAANEENDGHREQENGELAPLGSATEKPSGPDIWREWILEGRLDEARDALRHHLTNAPSDPEGWSLLGDCERKRGSWMDALAAYGRLAVLKPGESGNRARFKAAVILQDKLRDHRGAAVALEEMLSEGSGVGILQARAKVRLASSYSALGRGSEAKEMLLQVVEKYPGSPPAIQAKQMLEGMKGQANDH